jgi:hypothetical protein
MFLFEPIHYASNMLHPKYRHLKKTNSYDKHACKSFIRQMMKKVLDRENSMLVSPSSSSSSNDTSQSCSKKRKRFGEDYETGNVREIVCSLSRPNPTVQRLCSSLICVIVGRQEYTSFLCS